jgi:hypothetical protein
MNDFNVRKALRMICWTLALCVTLGCSSKAPQEPSAQPQVQVVFQAVQDPALEMCRDDTLSPTDHFNVPLVRFVGSTIELNGAQSSETELLEWAQKKYKNMAEQALWVQVSPDDRPRAERGLLPLAKSLPRLQFRLVDPGFTCGKERKDR